MSNLNIIPTADADHFADAAKLQLFEKILRENVEGIAIADVRGNIEWVNHAFSEFTGLDPEEILGKSLETLFVGKKKAYDALIRKLHTNNHQQAEIWMQHKNGSKFLAAITLTSMRSEADMVTHHVLEFSDITKFRHAQEELNQRTRELGRSNQELEQFAYVASHDLQEPLRMVASYTQLIAQRYQGRLDSDADEFIAFAVDGATRMQAIINDLLTLSRVNTRHEGFSAIEVQTALDRARSNLRLMLKESGAIVEFSNLPTIHADGSQLTQLFQNLMGNALKFRREDPPHIEIGARQQDEEWIFHVRDNGIGIPPEHYNRIFLMFQRLHARNEYPGTGIGLTICKKIVDRHGGRIWIESERGTGTTFFSPFRYQNREKCLRCPQNIPWKDPPTSCLWKTIPATCA